MFKNFYLKALKTTYLMIGTLTNMSIIQRAKFYALFYILFYSNICLRYDLDMNYPFKVQVFKI